ncbi:virulence factor Mce family protein [Aeromicrobium marinum DSM 15272]|uniref:Virulence factor Mce family protein n=1 Tax=Aeromicrobium marinum DSM 15272 TaxID=585531 RepID=E2SGA9_9ACTN|nr:MCE family protein [Aeromicrobium marinum]EFQ81866.1 virulence factor Mce family protein [Aeromicrobium marinum DSM 15272]
MKRSTRRTLPALALGCTLALSGCGFDALDLPLPGGADVGDDPIELTIEFRDVLDLVPQSAVRVNDLAVGRVTDIELKGWTAEVTVLVNGDVELPDNAEATIRQSSLLGEKFVSLAAPVTGGTGALESGDSIPLERAGRNPEIEEVLGAASLLLNGGGLEKTNTIVRELSAALDGNEPEIKQLLQTTTEFIGQLDANKDVILTSLEKVNNLALTANDQRGAIEGALDELPEALQVLDEQRAGLVRLTTSLAALGDTATDVIRTSRDDTVANLRSLEPILRNLALAGDDLVNTLSTVATFPFPNAAVGGSLASAQAQCSNDQPLGQTPSACGGDYTNLVANIDLSVDQLFNVLGLQGLAAPGLPADLPLPGLTGEDTAGAAVAGDAPVNPLVAFIEGLAGQTDEPETAPAPTGGAATPSPTPTAEGPSFRLPGLCNLFGQCRPAASSAAGEPGLTDLLTRPVVAR